ncbi:hypothetical protein Tco_0415434 [Tanacetum coccineum]
MEPRLAYVREATPVLQTGSPRVRRHGGRVIEFEEAPNRVVSRVERESDGRRPSKQRAEEGGSQGGKLPPLLTAHLGRSENGKPLQPTLTSGYGGNQPSTNLGRNLPPNSMYLSHNAPHFIPNSIQPPHNGQMPIYANPYSQTSASITYNRPPSYLFHAQGLPSSRWTEKIPSRMGSFDGKGDPDNYLHLFEGVIRMQKWAMPIACHMFTYTLKDSARI